MNVFALIFGLLAGLVIAGISRRVTAGFCLPRCAPAAATTGQLAFVTALFALLAFCLDPPPALDVPWGVVTFAVLALTTLGGLMMTVYVRRYEMTGLQAFGVAMAKFAFVLCMTGMVADFVRYFGASDAPEFWFTYSLSLVLTFLVLEFAPPSR